MSAKEWVLANKIKSGTGALLGIAGVLMLVVNTVTWAGEVEQSLQDDMDQKLAEATLIERGRQQVIHSTQKAAHDYDFYSMRLEQAEAEWAQVARGFVWCHFRFRRPRKRPEARPWPLQPLPQLFPFLSLKIESA